MVDKITKTSTKTIGGHRTCPRTWKKNKQHSICRRVSGLWPPVEHRPVRGGHRAAHPEGEVAAASAYLRFRGLILTQHHAAQLYPRCGYTIPGRHDDAYGTHARQREKHESARHRHGGTVAVLATGTADSDGWTSKPFGTGEPTSANQPVRVVT